MAVSALFSQNEMIVLFVELHSITQKILDGVITLLDDAPHDLLVAKSRARVQRVGYVVFDGVALGAEFSGQHGGDPTLSPRGVRFLGKPFRQNDHLTVLRRAQGKR